MGDSVSFFRASTPDSVATGSNNLRLKFGARSIFRLGRLTLALPAPSCASFQAEGVNVAVIRADINDPFATTGEDSTGPLVAWFHILAPVRAFSAYTLLSFEPT